MNKALKELFIVYMHLPVGVMVFKDKKLFFVNEHLRSILLLATLSSDDIIQIFGEMIQLESPSHAALYNFLFHNDFFLFRDQVIQIERQTQEQFTIFALIRISEQTLRAIDSIQPIRLLRQEKNLKPAAHDEGEWKFLYKVLGEKFEDRKFPSIVLYNDIPIKGNCTVVDIRQGEIGLKIDKRQLIAAKIGQHWLFGNKQEMMISGKISRYDILLNQIWLKNITLVSQGYHQRSIIRYIVDSNSRFSITIDGKKRFLLLRDVSEKGMSIQTDDSATLIALSSMIEKTLHGELIIGHLTIEIKAVYLYTVALSGSIAMKVAFSIGYDSQNGAILREWMHAKQLALIKEVRNYVQMISP